MPKSDSEGPRRNRRKLRDQDSVPQGGNSSHPVQTKSPAPLPRWPPQRPQPRRVGRSQNPTNPTAKKLPAWKRTPPPDDGEFPATRRSENFQSPVHSNWQTPTWRDRVQEDQWASYLHLTQEPPQSPQIFLSSSQISVRCEKNPPTRRSFKRAFSLGTPTSSSASAPHECVSPIRNIRSWRVSVNF